MIRSGHYVLSYVGYGTEIGGEIRMRNSVKTIQPRLILWHSRWGQLSVAWCTKMRRSFSLKLNKIIEMLKHNLSICTQMILPTCMKQW